MDHIFKSSVCSGCVLGFRSCWLPWCTGRVKKQKKKRARFPFTVGWWGRPSRGGQTAATGAPASSVGADVCRRGCAGPWCGGGADGGAAAGVRAPRWRVGGVARRARATAAAAPTRRVGILWQSPRGNRPHGRRWGGGPPVTSTAPLTWRPGVPAPTPRQRAASPQTCRKSRLTAAAARRRPPRRQRPHRRQRW